MKLSVGRKTFLAIDLILLISASLLCVLPFVNLLAISFSSPAYVNGGQVRFWPLGFTWSSYKFVAGSSSFMTALFVSIKRVLLGGLINMALLVLAAFPLSHEKSTLPGRNVIMWYFVVTMLISGGMIPLYLVINKLKLIDSIWSLVLPGAVPVYSMIILINFMRGLPRELEEAALIDGASPIQTLIRIILPVSKPGLATVALFCIVGHWNAWFDGIIYMNKSINYPLQSYLQKMVMNPEQMLRASGNDYRTLVSMISARTGRASQLFLGMLPILVVYPFLQKYFASGLVLGSVKG